MCFEILKHIPQPDGLAFLHARDLEGAEQGFRVGSHQVPFLLGKGLPLLIQEDLHDPLPVVSRAVVVGVPVQEVHDLRRGQFADLLDGIAPVPEEVESRFQIFSESGLSREVEELVHHRIPGPVTAHDFRLARRLLAQAAVLVLLSAAAGTGIIASSFGHNPNLLTHRLHGTIGSGAQEYSNIERMSMEITLSGACHEEAARA